MSTRSQRRQQRIAKRRRDVGAGFLGLTDMTVDRVVDLNNRWVQLQKWGVAERLPWTKETQKDVGEFFEKAAKGEVDVSKVVGMTAHIKALELHAEEWDKKNKVQTPFQPKQSKTPFDIDQSTLGLVAAKAVSESVTEAKTEAKTVVKDIAKVIGDEVGDAIKPISGAVPLWAKIGLGAVGLGVLAFGINQAVTAATNVASLATPPKRGA